jgi:VPS62-like protein
MRFVAVLTSIVASLVAAGATVAAPAATPDGQLLTRYAPVVVLHPQELFEPTTVDGFIADSDLLVRAADGTWAPATVALAEAPKSSRIDQRVCRAVDGPAAEPCYADAQAAHGSPSVAYGAVFRRSGRIVVQYWLWYPVNVYSPTVPAGRFWVTHEGDWESVTVILDGAAAPLLVGLSSHCGGTRRAWKQAPKRGSHPVTYVAKGSHANYFTAGQQRLTAMTEPLLRRCFTPEFVAIYRAYGVPLVDNTGRGRVVRPAVVRVTASTPAWMRFPGTWGEDQYAGFPDVPPFRSGTGPVGPAFHEQWRRPLAVPLAWRPG